VDRILREHALRAFAGIVGERNLLRTAEETAQYLSDQRARYHGQALGIALPASTEEISRLLSYCNERRIAVVPQGGNTGYCGGATPDTSGHQLVIAMRRMNRVRQVSPVNASMVVEAGCTLCAVQSAAREAGRYFPLSLGSEGSCQIGGNLSTNAGGVHVLRYGTARDLMLGLEVVLADGQIVSSLAGLRKDNRGYALDHLFVGAEGTLGLVTAACLKLFPAPNSISTALVAVPDLEHALQLLDALRSVDGLIDVGRDPPNFHFRSRPFLHFHMRGERMYADVRFGNGDFEPIWASTPPEREELLARVSDHVERLQSLKKAGRGRSERDRDG